MVGPDTLLRPTLDPDLLVRPEWPPLRHIRRGWDVLDEAERAEVADRVARLMDTARLDGAPDSLARFFAFLAQVETIAIEVPLRFLPTASDDSRSLLRRQLVDEVVHSIAFARLAHELAPGQRPDAPIASAERLLQRIRDEQDLATGAVLLNLVAEGWIETIFEHASRWGVADALFRSVLEDESRHVHEALEHVTSVPPEAAEAVAFLEQGLLEVGAEPSVALSILDLAGRDRYADLVEDLHRRHGESLTAVGLTPSPEFRRLQAEARRVLAEASDGPRPEPVPDTEWRRAARLVWDTPRDPTMAGNLDLPVGHIPKRLLTPVLVAAVAKAWKQNPDLNRVVARGKLWRLPYVNVGVRVLLDDGELATVIVPRADTRSVRDISRLIRDGVRQLQESRSLRQDGPSSPRMVDPRMADLLPPDAALFSVALSNPGKFGMEQGTGAFSGALSPSTDISIGTRARRPRWAGVMYVPAWHVHLGCLQDHRVFDGREAGLAMRALRDAVSKPSVREILGRKDTLPADDRLLSGSALPPSLRLIPQVGMGKYLPFALGGVALGAALGLGGYLLYRNLSDEDAPGSAEGTADNETPNGEKNKQENEATGSQGRGLAPPDWETTLPSGDPRCQASTLAGTQCKRAAAAGTFCTNHGRKG